MQDGRFRESQIEHFIGRAIFVFAGGTNETMNDFRRDMDDSDDEEAQKRARQTKTPDFISRLRGYLNILGLNPYGSAEDDPLYIIRRAIMLRAQLENNAKNARFLMQGHEFEIDPGVLNALLKVNNYRHGARSMEAAISMSLLSGRDLFERSALPSQAQLNLHVDAEQFIRLLNAQA